MKKPVVQAFDKPSHAKGNVFQVCNTNIISIVIKVNRCNKK